MSADSKEEKEETKKAKAAEPEPEGPHKVLGVTWAPFFIPLERRLQTLAVFTYMSIFLTFCSIFCLTMGYLLFYTSYW